MSRRRVKKRYNMVTQPGGSVGQQSGNNQGEVSVGSLKSFWGLHGGWSSKLLIWEDSTAGRGWAGENPVLAPGGWRPKDSRALRNSSHCAA